MHSKRGYKNAEEAFTGGQDTRKAQTKGQKVREAQIQVPNIEPQTSANERQGVKNLIGPLTMRKFIFDSQQPL